MRPHIVMAVKSNSKAIRGHIRPYEAIKGHKRPHKAIQGHIRPYKANAAIQFHNVPQKHNFCSIWNIFHSIFHAKKKNKNNKASFRTFERCSRSKICFKDYIYINYESNLLSEKN